MRYAQIRKMDISNGLGVGVSLFVQGCHFHCKGCFNPETWDFNGGKQWNQEIEDKLFELIDRPYIKRISILGGEPLADQNVDDVGELLKRIKKRFPNKIVWMYSGYKWEDIITDVHRFFTIIYTDVLVDGQFQIDKQDILNEQIVFAGSTNQRIIDVKGSLASQTIQLFTDNRKIDSWGDNYYDVAEECQ